MARFRWRGLNNLLKDIDASPNDTMHALQGATFEKANEVMTDAKEVTPADEGVLKSSGFAENPVVRGPRVTVKIGFGGPAAPYAIRVHEDLVTFGLTPGGGTRARNNPHRTFVGHAKYLEMPLNNHRRTMEEDLARKVRGRIFRNRG